MVFAQNPSHGKESASNENEQIDSLGHRIIQFVIPAKRSLLDKIEQYFIQ